MAHYDTQFLVVIAAEQVLAPHQPPASCSTSGIHHRPASRRSDVRGATKMPSSEPEQAIDLWAEQRGEAAGVVGQLRPGEALEIVRRVVAECTEGRRVVPMLLGTLRGVVERSV